MKRALGLAVSVAAFACSASTACMQKGGPVKVDSVEPPQGTTGGGEEISIVGGGFQPGKTQAEVKFGRKKCETVTIASTSKIRVVTPPNEKGPVDVSVMFDDGSARSRSRTVSATSSPPTVNLPAAPSSAAKRAARRRRQQDRDREEAVKRAWGADAAPHGPPTDRAE